MLTEQFLPIKDYEGLYEVSNFGRVKSLKRTVYNKGNKYIKEKIIMTTQKNVRGYPTIVLYKRGTPSSKIIHHLVWDHFGDKPRNGRLLQIDHIDNDKTNNHIDNLQLLTGRENITKRYLSEKTNELPVGVRLRSGWTRYSAEIQHNKKKIWLGLFDTPEEASIAYQNKLKEITGSPTVSTLTTSY